MITNDLEQYLPSNAETYDEVYQYYSVRCSEWSGQKSFSLMKHRQGFYIAEIKDEFRIGYSVYIPYSLRGKGLLGNFLRNEFNEQHQFIPPIIITMTDCHVIPVLEKLNVKYKRISSLSDNFIYRELRGLLAGHKAPTHLKERYVFEMVDYESEYLLSYINHFIKTMIPFRHRRLSFTFSILALAYDDRIDEIVEMIK